MDHNAYRYTAQVFDAYEKRFAQARMMHPLRDPADPKDRADILREAREMLGIDQIPKPTIEMIQQTEQQFDGVTLRIMQFRSWEHCYGEASLLLPTGSVAQKRPAVVICNGHSPQGRLGDAYQRMAFRLASHGFVVLMSDNMGQGSRKEFGHWDAEAPLCAGITLQGMIVSETNGWIEWLAAQPFVDASRIGACGNSGGGTLTLFLCATNPHLAAVASCGYPSEFSYVHQKEKKHCCCNLLKGCANRAEMWEIYASFAPKPLMLNSGKYDPLFPFDMVRRTARKIKSVYAQLGASDAFTLALTETKHPWELADIDAVAAFFCRHFSWDQEASSVDSIPSLEEGCRFVYPEDALSTNRLVGKLLGKKTDETVCLADVYPPVFNGALVDKERLASDLFSYDVMRILAQMEMALSE